MALTKDDYINQYTDWAKNTYGSQRDTQSQALKNAYDQNMLNINNNRSTIENDYSTGSNKLNELRGTTQADYTKAANTPDVNAAQSARKLSEMLAQKGLSRGGTYVSGQVGIMNQAAQQKNDLSSALAQALSSIGNRQSELEQQRASQLANITNQGNLYGQQYNEGVQNLANQYASQVAAAQSQAPLLAEDYLNKLYNQNLQAYQTGLGSLIDIGQITNQLNLPEGFYPGDLAKQYLSYLLQAR